MQYSFTPMTDAYARAIVGWTYEEPYASYNYANEADHIMDAGSWGKTLFAALDEGGRLIGELSFGFLDETDEWVSREKMEAGQLDGCILWVGFGLRPDLTGRGQGLAFVNACVDFAVSFSRQHYNYQGEFVGLGVYCFNRRAIKVYERAGFETFMKLSREVDEVPFDAQRMKKRVDDASIGKPAHKHKPIA